MSSLSQLYGGGGGGTPVNSIARLNTGGQTQYTDLDGAVWLKTGGTIASDPTTYPDAIVDSSNVTSATYDSKSFSVVSQDATPTGIDFSSDGTKMYMIGDSNNAVYQYSLSTAFDLSTASYDNKSWTCSQPNPQDIRLSNDGTKIFVLGWNDDLIYEHSLGTAFDISTTSNSYNALASTPGESLPAGMAFNNDGTKLYYTGVGVPGKIVGELILTTPFSLVGVIYPSSYFDISSQASPDAIEFNNNGTKMYINGGRKIYQYSLGIPFELTTASYDFAYFTQDSADVGNTIIKGLFFNTDIGKFFSINSDRKVYQYSLSDTMGISAYTGVYDYVKLK